MSAKSAINKAVFTPHDEKMLAAVQVKRRTKKKIPFLATGGQGDYMTFICLSVTNKKPSHVSITKVKQFPGSSSFAKRSMWTIDQLRQVNGCDPNKDCPEFDLAFDNAFDQWVAGSAGEKCTFIQILHHTCQRYSSQSKPEFVNCQSKLLGDDETVDSVVFRCKVFLNRMRKEVVLNSRRQGRRLLLEGNSILHSAADSVTSAVQKASQALNERGERLSRAEEKTGEMKNSAEQFSVTAHKLAMKHKC
ncbi:syntaxin-binding protein 6-like isoform 1-T1 [Salvelinus alpinus]|uniref:syntaxin-binding protein 6-like isoform X1 n=1 Tax=Salvelinus fontinalis TaxID=8038 RepID=UPI002485489D|nr:syntaxin-binding protein 6-like isoform X1 [Salvelinus fontinalis]